MTINPGHVLRVNMFQSQNRKCHDKATASDGSITCCNPDKSDIKVSEEKCNQCYSKRSKRIGILYGKNEVK